MKKGHKGHHSDPCILQNLLNKWPPQTVSPSPALPPDRRAVGEELVVEEEVRGVNGGEGDDEVGHLAPEEDEGVHVELVVHVLLELPQHPTHLLLGVVNHSPRRPWKKERQG